MTKEVRAQFKTCDNLEYIVACYLFRIKILPFFKIILNSFSVPVFTTFPILITAIKTYF